MPTSKAAKGPDVPAPSSPQAGKEGRKLSTFLCFAVYSANLAFGRAYKPILDELGLTYTQYITMVALSEEDDQTVGALGEKMFLESNTLTPILKKLESNGYITRHRDPADERQVRVSLTPAGRQLVETDRGDALLGAIGLGDDFPVVQKSVTTLRDNLLRSTQGEPGKS
ncbi:MarR family winged helix-turn-helix transcriptional regulator [Rhizobium ruizarguesonis]|uniref:MarR family winged helix-turn-helix transcriptional regulator n=1 Tax=Rhizobium ruizarguesonis TaxID=2081791 RepID=A0ACD5ETH2_9HYPH|nr:MarR family transcriptional regulator [Rhizobium leguminosarum]